MKLIRVSAHVGGPGSRRYGRRTDPFAARGREELGFNSRDRVGFKKQNKQEKMQICACKMLWSVLEWSSQTLLLPDGGFIPPLDFSGAKASVFRLNYECVGGWEFLITKTHQSRLENTVDIHPPHCCEGGWSPRLPCLVLPSCKPFVHHTEDKSVHRAGELCIFQSVRNQT